MFGEFSFILLLRLLFLLIVHKFPKQILFRKLRFFNLFRFGWQVRIEGAEGFVIHR